MRTVFVDMNGGRDDNNGSDVITFMRVHFLVKYQNEAPCKTINEYMCSPFGT